MKKQDFDLFANELEDLCLRHGVVMFGGCHSEGMLSEVYIAAADSKDNFNGWINPSDGQGFESTGNGGEFGFIGKLTQNKS